MKLNLASLQQRFKKPGKPQKQITLEPGHTAIILMNDNAVDTLIHAMADAQSYTGFEYSEQVMNHSQIIKN